MNDQIIRDLTETIRLNPEDATAYCNRGSAYINKGDYDQAIADCDQAIKIDPENATAYHNRGSAYIGKGDYYQAIADCDQAMSLNPEDKKYVYLQKAYIHLQRGGLNHAAHSLSEAIERIPDNATTYLVRGNFYHTMGNLTRAIEDYDNAVRLCPNYETDFMDSDLAYGGKAAIEEAVRLLSIMIVNKPPENAADYYYSGVRELFWNERDKARDYFEKSLELNYDDKAKVERHLENLR